MVYLEKFAQWKNDPFFDFETRTELGGLRGDNEIEDRFYKELEFGTGGLRGIMGAGTNRMNKYTVGKATTGLANYLIATYGEEECKKRGVAIGYDTRNNSKFFAEIVANVLIGMGVKAYLYSSARPTPQLSFSVRKNNCLAGVVITASHNPKDYNGYKVYDEFGCQLVPKMAEEVIKHVNELTDYKKINFTLSDCDVIMIDDTDDFIDTVLLQSRLKNEGLKQELSVVYTPLHGAGYIPVMEVLKRDSFRKLNIVPKQAELDGDFPTVSSPNPEDKLALDLGIELAKTINADIVLGTDPDCDRVGIAVRSANDNYYLLSGNQIGALLVDYLLSTTDLSNYKKPTVVKTIVTSELGAEIAKKKGIEIFTTLTGFKFIGEKITQFEQARNCGDTEHDFDFLFGYEESYGYLAGLHARDKDAVVSCMLICEMAALYKKLGKNLIERLEELYSEFGYYLDELDSFTFSGKTGQEHIENLMNELREDEHLFEGVKKK